METPALLAGFVSGLAIALQVGAVSMLLVDVALTAGPGAGIAAGMGVATADLAFAAVAVTAGGAARAVLTGQEPELRAAAAATLTAIALRGLWSVVGARSPADPGFARAGVGLRQPEHSSRPAHYLRFLAITSANPLTIVSFGSVAASLSLTGFSARVAFVTGVGAASAAWHGVLTLAAGHAGRRLTPPTRRALAISGRLVMLGVAVRLVLAI